MKSTEIHRVPYGSKNITYALEYSPRKTLAIEVHPDSSIVVKAPKTATIESIESKIVRRAAWIAKQQRQFAKYAPPLPAPQCISGEGYRFRFPNHSANFYKLLATILPDWNTRKNYLNARIELRLR